MWRGRNLFEEGVEGNVQAAPVSDEAQSPKEGGSGMVMVMMVMVMMVRTNVSMMERTNERMREVKRGVFLMMSCGVVSRIILNDWAVVTSLMLFGVIMIVKMSMGERVLGTLRNGVVVVAVVVAGKDCDVEVVRAESTKGVVPASLGSYGGGREGGSVLTLLLQHVNTPLSPLARHHSTLHPLISLILNCVLITPSTAGLATTATVIILVIVVTTTTTIVVTTTTTIIVTTTTTTTIVTPHSTTVAVTNDSR